MAPRLPLVLEDVRLLLLRLAHQESLSVDCGGGASRSNLQLIPYQMQVCYITRTYFFIRTKRKTSRRRQTNYSGSWYISGSPAIKTAPILFRVRLSALFSAVYASFIYFFIYFLNALGGFWLCYKICVRVELYVRYRGLFVRDRFGSVLCARLLVCLFQGMWIVFNVRLWTGLFVCAGRTQK